MSILVGSLPSREGRAALQVAVDECLIRGADLDLVEMPDGGRGFEEDEKALWQDGVRAAEQRMAEGGRKITLREATGDDIAHSLVEYAEANDAALIVIGLRRRSPWASCCCWGRTRAAGSARGRCPVLAVEAPNAD